MTRAERTLLDLGAELDERAFERVVAHALVKRRTNPRKLKACLERLEGRGRRGIVALRKLFQRRGEKLMRLESELEAKYAALFARLTIPMPEEQYELPEKGTPVYRLDFAYPEYQLGIEIDSYIHHSSRKDWAADQVRTNQIVSWGWSILHFTAADLTDPGELTRTIQGSLWERGWR